MKKIMQIRTVVPVALLVLVGVAVWSFVPTTSYAAPKGNAWGYYGMAPGHMKHSAPAYRFRGNEFYNMEELREYIREYIRTWHEMHGYRDTDYTTQYARITTLSAVDIEDTEAVLRATVTLNDEDEVDVWFEYGTALTALRYKTSAQEVDRSGVYSRKITGLEEDEQYYYRAVVRTEGGALRYGATQRFTTEDDGYDDEDDNDSERPDIETLSARNVSGTGAQLRGEVDMQDFSNGTVFFVYGTSRTLIEDVEDETNGYDGIEEDGKRLQKFEMDSSFDDSALFMATISGLSRDTVYYYSIGVEYRNDNNRREVHIGSVESFRTD
jgi:hypothetical protein